ncbi:MAG: DNA-binding protein [Spirochaetota bacterium]|nr:DNA-binding protein [Spirochaetota bacterium]
MEKKLSECLIVAEAVKLTGIPKSSVTKFCRENRILSRLADGKIWLIDKDSLLKFEKKEYHPRLKRRKTKS